MAKMLLFDKGVSLSEVINVMLKPRRRATLLNWTLSGRQSANLFANSNSGHHQSLVSKAHFTF